MAKRAAVSLVVEAKSWIWENFSNAMEKDLQLVSRMFRQIIQWLRKTMQMENCWLKLRLLSSNGRRTLRVILILPAHLPLRQDLT